jgi:hypothetical protein
MQMNVMEMMGKGLVLIGGLIVLVGIVLMFSDKIPFLGRLPGDLSIKRDNFQLYFPITTSIVLSILISAILWIFSHFKGK